MRLIPFVLAAFVVSGPAAAQTWQEYNYPDYSFGVQFPADPQVQMTTYQVAEGRSVPARVYSVQQNNTLLTMTVADLANTGVQEGAAVDYAVKRLSEGADVQLNYPHRIYQVYGRQLSIVGRDGSRNTVAVFNYNGRLYQIEGKRLPGGSDIDIIRFQQSLTFPRDSPNRSAEEIQAFRAACQGLNANPAGLDDPRCVRQ